MSSDPSILDYGTWAVALAVAVFTALQWKLARDRLKFDIFERRYAVYRFFEEIYVKVLRREDIKPDINDLRVRAYFAASKADFLMGREVGTLLRSFWEKIDLCVSFRDIDGPSAEEAEEWLRSNKDTLFEAMSKYMSIRENAICQPIHSRRSKKSRISLKNN